MIFGTVTVGIAITGIMLINVDFLKNNVESDFINKIREMEDDSEPMIFTLISKDNPSTGHQNYCGHTHMAIEEYWYFADVHSGGVLSSNVTQDVSAWCEDDDDSCYCELCKVIGADRISYEDFFREHVSATCPVAPKSENTTSFDPTQCNGLKKPNQHKHQFYFQ